jgi:two-component system, response regulator PdtaR
MNPLRVLVIEDETDLGALFGEVLEGMGYAVCAIEATEPDAVVAATRCKPDLMLVDVHLAVGSGISAVERILRSGFVPHVFFSADIAGVQALQPLAVALQKPFRIPDLAQAINRALGATAHAGQIRAAGRGAR